MKNLALLTFLYILTASAQMPVSVQCGGQSEYLGGFSDAWRMLQCGAPVSCETIAGTYGTDWDSMTDSWTEYTSTWSCYD